MHKQKNNKKSHKVSTASTPNGSENQTPPKRSTLSPQKRNEVNTLVERILQTTMSLSNNPKEEFERYLGVQDLVARIMKLEAPLYRPSANTTPAARLAHIEAFYDWAKANDIRFDGVRIAQFPGYELGLVATRNVGKDEQLFAVPRKAILSSDRLDPDFNLLEIGAVGAGSNVELSYALMVEVLKIDSYWKPYFDLLPERYNNVLYFTTKDMEQLRGSSALMPALRQCRTIARQYAFLYHAARNSNRIPNVSPLTRDFKAQLNYELFRWAVSTVMTRENLIPNLKVAKQVVKPSDHIACLIPFWDMANHRCSDITSFFDIQTQEMECNAPMDFKQGEQIFIHYGNRSNGELMLHNGFVDANNPVDYVKVYLGLNPNDALFDKRVRLLNLLDIHKNIDLQVLLPPNCISPELLAFVRVFNMNEEQLNHWNDSQRAADLMHIDCALETSLELKTWQYLQTRLMLMLRCFSTTLVEDEALLVEHRKGASKLKYTGAMVLEYRVLEKRILMAALDYVKQRAKA